MYLFRQVRRQCIFALFTLFSHGLHLALFRLCGCTEFLPRQAMHSDREESITALVQEHFGDGMYSVHLSLWDRLSICTSFARLLILLQLISMQRIMQISTTVDRSRHMRRRTDRLISNI